MFCTLLGENVSGENGMLWSALARVLVGEKLVGEKETWEP